MPVCINVGTTVLQGNWNFNFNIKILLSFKRAVHSVNKLWKIDVYGIYAEYSSLI